MEQEIPHDNKTHVISKKSVKERKPRKKKKSVTPTKTFQVEVIPAKKLSPKETDETPKLRVAAYCRVSTDEEEQESSSISERHSKRSTIKIGSKEETKGRKMREEGISKYPFTGGK